MRFYALLVLAATGALAATPRPASPRPNPPVAKSSAAAPNVSSAPAAKSAPPPAASVPLGSVANAPPVPSDFSKTVKTTKLTSTAPAIGASTSVPPVTIHNSKGGSGSGGSSSSGNIAPTAGINVAGLAMMGVGGLFLL